MKFCSALLINLKGESLAPVAGKTLKNDKNLQNLEKIAKISIISRVCVCSTKK